MFERINERIKQQIEKVEEMTGDMDPKTNFALIVIQTELERYKYLVRSYLRARIAKVAMESGPHQDAPRAKMWLTCPRIIDRQAYALLLVDACSEAAFVGDRACLRNKAPGSSAQPLPVVVLGFLPARSAEPQRHGGEHQHD